MASESSLPSVWMPFSDTNKILQHPATRHTWTIWLWNFSSFRIPIVRFIQELAEKQLRIFSRNFVAVIPGLSVLWSPRGPPSLGSSRPPFSRVPPSPTTGNNKTTVKDCAWWKVLIENDRLSLLGRPGVDFIKGFAPCAHRLRRTFAPVKSFSKLGAGHKSWALGRKTLYEIDPRCQNRF